MNNYYLLFLDSATAARSYYIVGSNDGNLFYPLQFVTRDNGLTGYGDIYKSSIINLMTTNYTDIINDSDINNLLVTTNITGYPFATVPFYYFRIIILQTTINNSLYIQKWFPIFSIPTNDQLTKGLQNATLLFDTTNSKIAGSLVTGSYNAAYASPTFNSTLTSYTWTTNNINWELIASSKYIPSSLNSEVHLFDNSINKTWFSDKYFAYNITYAGSITTTLNNITISGNYITISGNNTIISGEYIQLKASKKLILYNYNIIFADYEKAPAEFYIVGSNDQVNWLPIQFVILKPDLSKKLLKSPTIYVSLNRFDSTNVSVTNYNYALNSFTYFRIIFTRVTANINLNIRKINIIFAIETPIVASNLAGSNIYASNLAGSNIYTSN